MKKFLFFLFLAALVINAQDYDFEVLEGLGGMSVPYDINSYRDIVGYSFEGVMQHPVLWDRQENDVKKLGDLGFSCGYASAINDSNIIVGMSTTSQGDYHAFRWENDVMTDLGTLEGSTIGYWSDAKDINDSGLIVGWSFQSEDTHPRACLWTNGGTVIVDLGLLGSPWSEAKAINDSGQITGRALGPDGLMHGFLITPDQGVWNQDLNEDGINDLMIDIWAEDMGQIECHGIDNSGMVTGEARTLAGTTRAFTWTQTGGLVIICECLGQNSTCAFAINNSDKLSGCCSTEENWVGFIYDCDTSTMTNANDYKDQLVLWDIQTVYGINDDNEFVGIAVDGMNSCAFKMISQDNGSLFLNPLEKFHRLGD